MKAYKFANNVFYPYALELDYRAAGTWPEKGNDVSDAVYSEFTGEPPQGKVRMTDNKGRPAWGDVPALTAEQLKYAAELKKQSLIDSANDYINGKQWPGKAAIKRLHDDELYQFTLWLDYLDALEAIDITSEPDINWPVQP